MSLTWVGADETSVVSIVEEGSEALITHAHKLPWSNALHKACHLLHPCLHGVHRTIGRRQTG